jgi:hypothetical protein
MKKYRFVRALEGSPEGKVRRLSADDAASLLKSGAIVEHDVDDDDDDASVDSASVRLLNENVARVMDQLKNAETARDDAIGSRDRAVIERDNAIRDLDAANVKLSDTTLVDQLRNDLETALKRADQAESDLRTNASGSQQGSTGSDTGSEAAPAGDGIAIKSGKSAK